METLASTPTREPAFHADDFEQISSYRSLSALAIVGLVFGLAAPVCFTAPLFLSIPLFGAAVSIVALRRIATSEGALAGRWAAALGLALCVASGMAALSHAQVTRFLFSRQAQAFSRQWIDLLLAKEWEQAFSLTVASARPAPPEPGGPTAPDESPFDHFTNNPLVQSLAAAGAPSEIQFAGTTSYEPMPYHQGIVRQRYHVIPKKIDSDRAGFGQPVDMILALQRSRMAGETGLRWLVAAYEFAGDSAADTTGP